jgi:hypothetical protein
MGARVFQNIMRAGGLGSLILAARIKIASTNWDIAPSKRRGLL